MNDRRRANEESGWEVLRPLPARRATIIVWVLAVLAAASLIALDVGVLQHVAGLLAAALTIAIRRTIRDVTEVPEDELDERQVARRDNAYRVAYRTFTSMAALVALTLFVTTDASAIGYRMAGSHANAMFVLVLLAAIGLPAAVFGWTEAEV